MLELWLSKNILDFDFHNASFLRTIKRFELDLFPYSLSANVLKIIHWLHNMNTRMLCVCECATSHINYASEYSKNTRYSSNKITCLTHRTEMFDSEEEYKREE